MTKNEMMEVLAAQGIEFNANATKAQLEALIAGDDIDPAALARYKERLAAGQYRNEFSEAVGETWTKASVRKARRARILIEVDGVEYGSVFKAFQALGLPESKHIKFRGALRKAGELAFDGHNFKVIEIREGANA